MKPERSMKASDVRDRWSETVDTVANDEARIRIERSGTPVAGLVSARDLEWLTLRDQRLEELRAMVSQMRDAFVDVAPDEVEQEVARALLDVRSVARGDQASGEHLPSGQQ